MTRPRPLVACTLASIALAATATAAHGAELWVDGAGANCSDARSEAQVASSATPWCTLGPAGAQARAGDLVHILAATYRGTLRPLSSGTAIAPIRFPSPPSPAWCSTPPAPPTPSS